MSKGVCLKDVDGLAVGDEVKWQGEWRGVAMSTQPDTPSIAIFLSNEDEAHFNAPVDEITDVRQKKDRAA